MAKKIGITPEQIALVKEMLWDTWEYIGNDIMDATGGEALPRDHVVEAVLDADYMESQARGDSKKDALGAFKLLSYKERIKIAKTVFTAKEYA